MLNRQQCLMGMAAYHEAGYNWYTPRDDLVTVVNPQWDELILVFKDLVPTPDHEWDPDEWTDFPSS